MAIGGPVLALAAREGDVSYGLILRTVDETVMRPKGLQFRPLRQ